MINILENKIHSVMVIYIWVPPFWLLGWSYMALCKMCSGYWYVIKYIIIEITYKYVDAGCADSACKTWISMYEAYDRQEHLLYAADENSWIWLVEKSQGCDFGHVWPKMT